MYKYPEDKNNKMWNFTGHPRFHEKRETYNIQNLKSIEREQWLIIQKRKPTSILL